MVQTRRYVLEKGVDLVEFKPSTATMPRSIGLELGPPSFTSIQLYSVCGVGGFIALIKDIAVKIAGIAVLLKNESARYAWAKVGKLDVLEPHMPIGNQMLMREVLQKLHFNEHFLQPFVVVPDWHAFAGKVAQRHAVKNMFDEEHDSLAASAKLFLFDEETFEITLAEGSGGDARSRRLGCVDGSRSQ